MAYFDAETGFSEQTADLVIVSRRRGGIGAAAAEYEAQAVSGRAWATATTGWAAICRRTPIRAPSACSTSTRTTISGPARPSRSATTTTAIPDWPAARCWPTSSSACLTSSWRQVPPWVPRWGREHKEFVRDAYRRTIVVMGPVQEMPLADARVQVDPKVKDHWGIPVARLSGGRHPHTIEIGRYVADKAEEWLKEAGAVQTWKRAPGKSLSGGQHQAGTCRMGNDPKTSVVDRDCRVHDVDNVYVIDASVHVTNGGFNPALTILANAYRASDHLLQSWKGSRVRS